MKKYPKPASNSTSHRVSQMLEAETKKMEEKLDLVKKMIELEKDKRTKGPADPHLWRGTGSTKPASALKRGPPQQQQLAEKPYSVKIEQVPTGSKQQPMKAAEPEPVQASTPQAEQSQTEDEGAQVKSFLASIRLDKYFDKFIENGLDDLETILELQDSHIEGMGIPLGHKLKILKRIKDLRGEKGMATPMSRQSTKRESINYTEGISSKPITNHAYEVLPDPTETIEAVPKKKMVEQRPAQTPSVIKTVTFKKADDNTQIGMETLMDGAYNEDESHKSFLEALNAWRIGGKEEEKKEEQKAEPRIEKKVATPSIVTTTKSGTKVTRKVSPNESCWSCYKLYRLTVETSEFQTGDRGFCSRRCFEKFETVNMQHCALETCGKKFMKRDGILKCGNWYCSPKHVDDDPMLKDLEELQRMMNGELPDEDSEEVEIDL